MKDFIYNNRVFLLLYLVFFVAGGILLIFLPKGADILWLNDLHCQVLDVFFRTVHFCLDIPPKNLYIAFLMFLLLSYARGLLYTINMFTIVAFVITLADNLFKSFARPNTFFNGTNVHLNFVQGVPLVSTSGFPSSYACHIFGLMFMLSIFSINKKWSYLFFGVTMLAVVTRLYMFQNFFSGLYFGSAIGVGVTLAINLTVGQLDFFTKSKWKDRSLGGDIIALFSSKNK